MTKLLQIILTMKDCWRAEWCENLKLPFLSGGIIPFAVEAKWLVETLDEQTELYHTFRQDNLLS